MRLLELEILIFVIAVGTTGAYFLSGGIFGRDASKLLPRWIAWPALIYLATLFAFGFFKENREFLSILFRSTAEKGPSFSGNAPEVSIQQGPAQNPPAPPMVRNTGDLLLLNRGSDWAQLIPKLPDKTPLFAYQNETVSAQPNQLKVTYAPDRDPSTEEYFAPLVLLRPLESRFAVSNLYLRFKVKYSGQSGDSGDCQGGELSISLASENGLGLGDGDFSSLARIGAFLPFCYGGAIPWTSMTINDGKSKIPFGPDRIGYVRLDDPFQSTTQFSVQILVHESKNWELTISRDKETRKANGEFRLPIGSVDQLVASFSGQYSPAFALDQFSIEVSDIEYGEL